MNFWDAIILGIVEGLTEFLPISSTGHLILTSKLLGLPEAEFLKSFEIIIQLGAILAVVLIYWKSLLMNAEVMKRVFTAFLPTAFLGFLLYQFIKKFLIGNSAVVLWSFFLGGLFLILFERFHKSDQKSINEIQKMPYWKAFWIGVIQSLAMVPGVSRSGATIIGGLLLGMERKAIVEFSFLLAVPTMFAATAFDLIKSGSSFSRDQTGILLIGFVTSFFAALICVKGFLKYIQKHSFTAFGVYRIVLALIFWLF